MQTTLSSPIQLVKNQALTLAIPLYVYAIVLASLSIMIGLLWDISWHMTIGRDGLFSPPHNLIYIGASFAGILAGFQCLKISFWGSNTEKSKAINFWGIFYSSLGGLFCIWGGLTTLTSAPFDDWWHNTYGLDVQIFTPPHTVLLLGLAGIQLGAMFMVMAMLNRGDVAEGLSATQTQQRNQRLRYLFCVSAGLLLSMFATWIAEFIMRYDAHKTSYYQIGGIIFPLLLLSTGRASGLRWGSSFVSLVYMGVYCLTSWVLVQLPAEPLLGPVLNPVKHYQFFLFPQLLVIPALALDYLGGRYKHLNNWKLSLILGTTFFVIFWIVQWNFGAFLLESPLARNNFFGGNAWSYNNDPTWQYRYEFAPWNIATGWHLIQGLIIALGISILSSRIGLLWGNWMTRVQR